MHDLVIVGAGPVGATLALTLRESGFDVVLLDARPAGDTLRGDRTLALSHGSRLVLERVGVWPRLAEAGGAVTPITTIEISQAGHFGRTVLRADEQGLPALGYVVRYRDLQAALDAGLEEARLPVRHGITAREVGATATFASVSVDDGDPVLARLAVVADGTGAGVTGVVRRRHAYDQSAVIAQLDLAEAHHGVAVERFTPQGPVALLPEGERYGLVWTSTPADAQAVAALDDADFLARLAARMGGARRCFVAVHARRVFPLALEVASTTVAMRRVVIGNAAQALHPIAGQGFNLGLRDAYELGARLRSTPREAIGDRATLAAYASQRRGDRWGAIGFTHGLLELFGNDRAYLAWPRGAALALLDVLPPVKRAFTRTMLHGLRPPL